MSEFKYDTEEDTEKAKVYLIAILDMCSKRFVS